ncbi:MAG: SusC/RagA family TonB-linked outer membrane protein [Gemmatimonadetes bacterium]|nr:SusC/RagA family TonB-linked outer membrane protein [Gemmatimonadota bacterium]
MLQSLPIRFPKAGGFGTTWREGRWMIPALALAVLPVAAPLAAQTGTITGSVSDVETGQLLESALVRVDDAEGGVLTNASGRYVIVGVAAGSRQLTFEILGYDSRTLQIDVTAGQTAELNAELSRGALELQELIVTGVARATPKVKLPFTVEKLDLADTPVPAVSAENYLIGKVPGIKVVGGSGQPGTTGDILLRGATSINGSQDPLIIVDGVITTNSFDDIVALDIESMEVVKGAAGASLYGSRAANGVIQIRTKRGTGFGGRDYNQLVLRNETGQDRLVGDIQLSNYHPWEVDASGNLVDVKGNVISDISDPDIENPALNGDGVFKSFQDNPWPSTLPIYDQVDRVYTAGTFMSNYAVVEGRNGDTSYRSSFEWQVDRGVLSRWNDGFDRKGFRINLDHDVRSNLTVALSTSYTESEQEDLGSAPFYDLTFMGPYVDLLRRDPSTIGMRHCPANGCLYVNPDPLSNQDNPLYHFELVDNRDWSEDVKASVNARWTPFSWMDVEGVFGLDRNSFLQSNLSPPGRETAEGSVVTGSLWKRQDHRQNINSELTMSLSKAFGDLATRTRLRYLQESSHYEWFDAEGTDFVANDVPRLNNLNPDSYQAESFVRDIRSEGYFLITALDYRGKYIVDALARRDGSSLFGENERWHSYYRTALAWRLAQESWWPLADVNEFKLRWSIGTAGRRPGFSAQYETYSVSGGTIRPVTLGNKDLKPQRSTENEFGLDMVLFNTASIGVTYANTMSVDQLLSVPLPKAGGFSSQWQNAGTLESNTWETYVEVPIISNAELGWDLRVNLDRTRMQISELDRPAYRSNYFYFRDGEVFGAFYGAKWATTCEDLPAGAPCNQFQLNDDGLLVWTGGADQTTGISSDLWGTDSKGQTGDDTFQWGMPVRMFGECATRRQGDTGCKDFLYLGNSTPDFNVSAVNTFRWRGLSLYALFDGEFGVDIYNQTRQWAYRENRSGDQDQFGKPDGMKKPVAYYQRLYNTNAMNGWFVEEGTFVKLRELSVRYSLSPDWVDSIFQGRVTGAEINLIGRNLLTWTDYTGYDPEVGQSGNSSGGSDAIGRVDDYQYPNFRTLTASLQLIF